MQSLDGGFVVLHQSPVLPCRSRNVNEAVHHSHRAEIRALCLQSISCQRSSFYSAQLCAVLDDACQWCTPQKLMLCAAERADAVHVASDSGKRLSSVRFGNRGS